MNGKRYVLVLLLLIFNCLMLANGANATEKNNFQSLMRLEHGWKYQWGDTVVTDNNIPDHGWKATDNVKELDEPRDGREILYLRHTLPEFGWQDPAIFISFMYGTFQVFQGNELVYQYGEIPAAETVTYKGYNRRHLIKLNQANPSRELTIRSYSNGNLIGVAGAVSYGSNAAYFTNMIQDDLDKIVIGSVLLFLSVIGLIIFLWKRFALLYFAYSASAFCAALYAFSLTGVKQFIVDVPYLWIYVFQFAVFFRSAFDLLIVDKLFGAGYKKWVRRLWQFHLLLASIAFLLSVINPDYFTVTKGIFEKLSALEVLLIFAIVVRIFFRSVEAKIYAVGFLAMAGLMVRDLLVFIGVIYLDTFYLLGHIGQFALVIAVGIIFIMRQIREKRESL